MPLPFAVPALAVAGPIALKGGMALLGAAATAATAYDASKEYKAYGKGESMFNTDKQRADYNKKQFNINCQANPKFSKDCPNYPKEKKEKVEEAAPENPVAQIEKTRKNIMEKYGNIITLGAVFLLLLVVQRLT